MKRFAIAGSACLLAGCTTEGLMALEAVNASLTCMNAYPNDALAQSDCEAEYQATGYLPDTSRGAVSGAGYGAYGGGGYGSYPATPSGPPDQPFTVTGSGSASVRPTALQSAYNSATSSCTTFGGTLGSTEFQDCEQSYDTWYCTVRVWCG